MKKLLSIPILTAYLYIITIVTFYGFNSYFNIPYAYIEFSVKTPIVFLFDLSRLIFNVLAQVSALTWIGLGVVLVFLVVLSLLGKVLKWLTIIGLIVLAAYLPFGFYQFGSLLASESTSFYTAPSNCIPGATKDLYIAPTFFEGSAIFVPIDRETLKLKNGLLVKQVSDLKCQMEKNEIGKILK